MRFFDYQRSNKEPPSRSSSTGDDSDGPVEPPSITQFFADASLYKQAISNPEDESFYRASDNETIQDFAELVGRHLNIPERALAGRFAKLSVEDGTWIPEEKDDDKSISEEPEEYEEEAPIKGDTLRGRERVPLRPDELPLPSPPAAADEAEPTSNLTPDEIVELLIQEHGALAPDGEEKLIVETDAAFMQDLILLVGVLHITTHRVAFHASLLDEPNKPNDIIKAGAVTVHRKGLHRKRRVWLELSRDFVCSFPSAEESDRIRPLKSILLSAITEVCVEDPQEPNIVRAAYNGHSTASESEAFLEFDTVESAREWRRELQGAVFMYKRSLLATMQGVEADTDGVRISIPLQCIDHHTLGRYMGNLHIISLSLSAPSSLSDDNDTASTDSDHSIQSVEFVATSITDCKGELDMVLEAKKTLLDKDDQFSKTRKVIVDYGSLGFPQPRENDDGVLPRSREQVVCDAIGIIATPDAWMTQARIHGVTISSGFFVVTPQWVGFWCKSLASKDQIYRISISTIHSAAAAAPTGKLLSLPNLNLSMTNYHLVLDIQGHPSLRFQFRSEKDRNEATRRIKECLIACVSDHSSPSSVSATPPEVLSTSPTPFTASPSSTPSSATPVRSPTQSSASLATAFDSGKLTPPTSPNAGRRSSAILAPLSRVVSKTTRKALGITPSFALTLPKAVNIPRDTLLPIHPHHFVCLTIGSRGDVQPYIALSLGLKKGGHSVTIVTHEEYKEWVESFGIGHRTAGGDPGMLMKLSVENKMFSPQFFKEGISNYRKWLDKLLIDAWEQCKDAEVLLESPYAMGGVHIAEALNIPYFRVCTMPWTKTTQFPHPFISPPVETPKFNSMSYVLFDNVFWAATSSQINRWRAQYLHLPATDMSHLAQSKIPIIYNFSPSVVPKPLDWNDTCVETGYWFLNNPDGPSWTPPPALVDFMTQARKDNRPIVYIGFGSITVPNPHSVTEKIYQAVVKSDVRAIISKGWSARMSKSVVKEPEMPKECYVIDKIPHDWLFPRIDAALHHGGAGTTSASLRAGIPTLIKPWFGDQYFWASRVHKLGAGMKVSSLRVNDVANALTRATTDRIMKEKAIIVGEKIRAEDGVLRALQFISIYLPTAVRSPQLHRAETTEH